MCRVALDVAVLVERLECPRELALVAVDQLREPHHTQSVTSDAGIAEPVEHLEAADQSGRARVHGCILPDRTSKDATRFECRTRSRIETALTPEERRVCDEIAAGESELVDLLAR